MFIEEVIIDGFKSYAARTVISGWDKNFNAITGLNGSGKSNILDAICFVLGISKLDLVRVGNLQELVYKQGQAGVTKASVTLVFNNSDTSESPPGYEKYEKITVTRQIVMGGRSKYLINGHTAQVGRVHNLFHSVQLNVNNPHFLIMQGRITKVLNMKPAEILGLIEEAAGTRMFETKKQAALRTIEKKQQKVDDINDILANSITPSLESLRKDRATYLRWSKNATECERLARFTVAAKFVRAEKLCADVDEQKASLNGRISELKEEIKVLKSDVKAAQADLAQLQAQRDRELSTRYGAELQREEELSKELVKVNSSWQNKKQALLAEVEAKEKCELELRKNVENLEELKEANAAVLSQSEAQVEALHNQAKTLELLQSEYQDLCTGVSGDNDAGNLQAMLMKSEAMHTDLASQIAQTEMRIQHAEEEKSSLEKQLAKLLRTARDQQADVSAAQTAVSALREEIASLRFDENRHRSLIDQRTRAQKKITLLQDQAESLWATVSSRLTFDYNASALGAEWDDRRVKGVVASLLRLRESSTATAIEVAAGGRLYQVIVDTEQTGKLLLQKGHLKRRVTIIPLNKVTGRLLSDEKCAAVQSKLGDRAATALSLVCYDDDLETAMRYVFGTTLICKDADAAKAAAFDKDINVKCVTLEGDCYDPAGTLEGGSRQQRASFLAQLAKLTAVKDELYLVQADLDTINKQIQEIDACKTQFEALQEQLQTRSHELALAEKRLETTDYGVVQQKVTKLSNSISEMCTHRNELANQAEDCTAEIARLQTRLSARTGSKDEAVSELKAQITAAKDKFAQMKQEASASAAAAEEAKQEIASLQADIDSARANIASSVTDIDQLTAEVETLAEAVASTRAEYDVAREALAEQRAKLAECDEELSSAQTECERKTAKLHESEREVKTIAAQLQRIDKDASEARQTLELMLEQHAWIEAERQYFGQPHTDFDFNERDPKEAEKLLAALEQEQAKLSRKINKKVLALMDTAEKEYQDLMKKRAIIENDKAKIERVIAELDEKKNEALHTTWQKVNSDFGSIFSTLLPGTSAKLDRVESGAVLAGLEVKIAFNGVWKESLTELSGGQRSLVALSLILALLRFKPAPMYILDEVDAALDLSHTQNIGHMLRTHFSSSQFIVVSLKQGMFNNANVVFRTKFVDGVSTVARTVPAGSRLLGGKLSPLHSAASAAAENAEASALKASVAKRARSSASASFM